MRTRDNEPNVYFIAVNWREGNVVSEHFRALGRYLANRGDTVVLFADQHQFSLENVTENPAVHVWPSAVPTRLKDLIFLLKLVRKYRPEYMIGVFRPVNILMIAGWLMRVPNRIAWYMTTSNQSVFEMDRPTQLLRKFQIFRKSLIYRISSQVMTSSAAMKQDLFSVYGVPNDRVAVSPNSIQKAADAYLEYEKHPWKIVCVGRLYNLKGQQTLIQAAALLAPDFPDLRVDFLGSGPSYEAYRRLVIELGLEEVCHFHGNVTHDVVLEEMAHSAITIVPSKDEAFGYVNIESMAVRTPVVASAVGGIPEVIRDGVDGLLVPPDDPAALAHAIKTLLLDPGLRGKMGEYAYQRFMEVFEREVVIREQVKYFDQIGLQPKQRL